MEPTRQIFAPRRFAAVLGVLGLFALCACSTLDDAIRQIQSKLGQTEPETTVPPAPAPVEPEPLPSGMAAVEEPKPPMQMGSRMASKTPTPRPRPLKPAAPNEQAAPKPPALPRVVPADLIGSDFAEVLRRIRQPDTVQTSALAIIWTYSEPVCKLQLYFYPDIETTTFHVLKYDLKDAAGGKLDNAGPCMQRIIVARNDAAPSP